MNRLCLRCEASLYLSVCMCFLICLLMPTGAQGAVQNIEWKPIGKLSHTYDSNITYAETGEISDHYETLEAGMAGVWTEKSYTWDMNAVLREQVFLSETDFNNLSGNVETNLAYEASPFDRVNVGYAFFHGEEPRSFDDTFGRTSGRYSYDTHRIRGSHEHDFSKSLRGRWSYAYNGFRPDRVNISDTDRHAVLAEMDIIADAYRTYLTGVEVSHLDFSAGSDGQALKAFAGMKHLYGKTLTLTMKAGVTAMESFQGNHIESPYLEAQISDEISARSRIDARIVRETKLSSFREEAFEAWSISATYTRQLLDRLQWNLTVFFGEGEFDQTFIEEETLGVESELSYELNERAELFLAYARSENDSTDNTRDYEKDVVNFGVRITF